MFTFDKFNNIYEDLKNLSKKEISDMKKKDVSNKISAGYKSRNLGATSVSEAEFLTFLLSLNTSDCDSMLKKISSSVFMDTANQTLSDNGSPRTVQETVDEIKRDLNFFAASVETKTNDKKPLLDFCNYFVNNYQIALGNSKIKSMSYNDLVKIATQPDVQNEDDKFIGNDFFSVSFNSADKSNPFVGEEFLQQLEKILSPNAIKGDQAPSFITKVLLFKYFISDLKNESATSATSRSRYRVFSIAASAKIKKGEADWERTFLEGIYLVLVEGTQNGDLSREYSNTLMTYESVMLKLSTEINQFIVDVEKNYKPSELEDSSYNEEYGISTHSFSKATYDISQRMKSVSTQMNNFALATKQISNNNQIKAYTVLAKGYDSSLLENIVNGSLNFIGNLLKKNKTNWKEKKLEKAKMKSESFANKAKASELNIENIIVARVVMLSNLMQQAFSIEKERGDEYIINLLKKYSSFVNDGTVKLLDVVKSDDNKEELSTAAYKTQPEEEKHVENIIDQQPKEPELKPITNISNVAKKTRLIKQKLKTPYFGTNVISITKEKNDQGKTKIVPFVNGKAQQPEYVDDDVLALIKKEVIQESYDFKIYDYLKENKELYIKHSPLNIECYKYILDNF